MHWIANPASRIAAQRFKSFTLRIFDDSVNLCSPSPDTCGNLLPDDDVAKWFKAADCNSAIVSSNLTVILKRGFPRKIAGMAQLAARLIRNQ